jgi:hypothetical protein
MAEVESVIPPGVYPAHWIWRLGQLLFVAGESGENGLVLLDLVRRRCIEVEDVPAPPPLILMVIPFILVVIGPMWSTAVVDTCTA